MHELKRNTFLIETNDSKFILKICNYSILSRLWYNLKNGKPSSFRNEILVRKELDKKDFRYFKYPRLLKTDDRSYIVLEFIEGKDGWEKDVITNKILVSSLLEFQFSRIKLKKSLVSTWNRTIPIKVIRWSYSLLNPSFDIISYIKCILLAVGTLFTYKEKGIITHNDLFRYNNLITGNDKKTYFYDFEFTTDSNPFFLIDIFDLCFDMEKFTMNVELLEEYIRQLSDFIPINTAIRCLERETRLIIIRKLLGTLISTRDSETKKGNSKFIKKIILSKKRYRQWYKDNIAISYEFISQRGNYK